MSKLSFFIVLLTVLKCVLGVYWENIYMLRQY